MPIPQPTTTEVIFLFSINCNILFCADFENVPFFSSKGRNIISGLIFLAITGYADLGKATVTSPAPDVIAAFAHKTHAPGIL